MKLSISYRNSNFFIDKSYFLDSVKTELDNEPLFDIVKTLSKDAKNVDEVSMIVNLLMVQLNNVRTLINKNSQENTINQDGTIFFNPENRRLKKKS